MPATSPRPGVLLLQDFSGDGEVAVWVEQVARADVALLVVAEVDLAQARVDARGGVERIACCKPAQASARVAIAARLAGDVERPRPRTMRPLRRMPLSCKATA